MTDSMAGIFIPFYLADRVQSSPRIVYVAENDAAILSLQATLEAIAPHVAIIDFPEWDCPPFDVTSPSTGIMGRRLRSLTALAQGPTPAIMLTSAKAVIQRILPPESAQRYALTLAIGSSIARDLLLDRLVSYGYRRTGNAYEGGEFAVHGGVVDIMIMGESQGVRIDFFGDTIETLRRFEPSTQLSSMTVKEVHVYPVSEVVLTRDNAERFHAHYRTHAGIQGHSPLREHVANRQRTAGIEQWLPLFEPSLTSLSDYCREWEWIMMEDLPWHKHYERIHHYYHVRTESALTHKQLDRPLPVESLYIAEDAMKGWLLAHPALPRFGTDGASSLYRPLPADMQFYRMAKQEGGDAFAHFSAWRLRHPTLAVIIACPSLGMAERVVAALMRHSVTTRLLHQWNEHPSLEAPQVGLFTMILPESLQWHGLWLLSTQDLMGDHAISARPSSTRYHTLLQAWRNIAPGELVVHKKHGIGRFEGLTTIDVSHLPHECLHLTYAGGDRLYVPVDQVNMISRYGSDNATVALDKLGLGQWQQRHAAMKERITALAQALMLIAAKRQMVPGERIILNHEAYGRFCDRFPYPETADQLSAITDVLHDLTTGRLMDRLVCGDVGFGKTEIALRAACAVITGDSPKQVLMIVPTTLLCRQHYTLFHERFHGLLPTGRIHIAQLSRLVTAAEARHVREGLRNGTIDMVIGTHALLADTIACERLGLVIIDEEQHFGVAQKEKLKALKDNVHVLTLTATPIPRTLQMSLTGLRDLSLITTPPVDRLAVQTRVLRFDPVTVRDACLREKERGGALFCVVPHIEDIAPLHEQLSRLVPECRIITAHGKMRPSQLEHVIESFYDGSYDILLSTPIIESGLDVPRANSILVFHADHYGLAQLYQLRGRVGRSTLQAYAYFILPDARIITPQAEERLHIMERLDSLGLGFTLSSHDMDMRGFGNLVGKEQSGTVREVGIELYQEMLHETMLQHKASASGAPQSPQTKPDDITISLGLPLLIPAHYIADDGLRLSLYRRLASLGELSEFEAFTAELTDRFGPVPEEAHFLIHTMRLKQYCKSLGITQIEGGSKAITLRFMVPLPFPVEQLMRWIQNPDYPCKLRSSDTVLVTIASPDATTRLFHIEQVLSHLQRYLQ